MQYTDKEVEEKFKLYFDPEELVSYTYYKTFKDKQDIYKLFHIKLKHVIVFFREKMNKPFYCNNWHLYIDKLEAGKTVAQLEKELGIIAGWGNSQADFKVGKDSNHGKI